MRRVADVAGLLAVSGPGDLDEMFDDAADTAIRDMERAGIDVITDGEVRRLDGYVDSYYAIIKGIRPLAVRAAEMDMAGAPAPPVLSLQATWTGLLHVPLKTASTVS